MCERCFNITAQLNKQFFVVRLHCIFAAPPTVIRPPPATANLAEGETLVIECEAIGVPTPIIVWRLNWGHVGEPPRVSTTTDDGQGKITIRNVKKEDEGAYTCEALNNKGSIFAQPDTILIVSRKYLPNHPSPPYCQS